jgi:hypothetical protein
MADVLFLAVTVAFFALTVLFVKVCDRLIGPEPERSATPTGASEPVPASAGR